MHQFGVTTTGKDLSEAILRWKLNFEDDVYV